MASPPPSAPAGAAGLEGLEGLVLHTVITKAGARPAAALSCASTCLRAAVAEDAIWRRFCAEDLGLDAPLDPEDRPLPSFKDAYKVWLESFVPEACMLGGVYYSSCQLDSRHWIIRWRGMVVSDVRGEGVIGEYPLLLPGQQEFVYESCTPMSGSPGSVEGSFTFVPGRLSRPEGKPFEVTVAPFPLETPEYIF